MCFTSSMNVSDPVFDMIGVGPASLRTATWGTATPDIVVLHDGLGSISQWRSVPSMVAEQTGRTVLAYERSGHGESLPHPTGPWPPDWLHREASVLAEVLDVVGAVAPVIVGHSDGGSAALLYSAHSSSRARAVLALAAHSWVEDICFTSIVDMRANRARIEAGLARYHQAPEALFEAWSGVWVSDAFRDWDIRPALSEIEVPVLIAQGANDAYASDDHAHLTAAAIGGNAASIIVPELGHIMHHDDADAVVELIIDFVDQHS
jgi:pimeloyl-ACP methyl ester carboxylesterase